VLAHVASKSTAQSKVATTTEKRTHTAHKTHVEAEQAQASAKRSKEALDKVAREIQKIAKLEAETHSVQQQRLKA
jgi:hypothetical protein